jgi:small-conductance mechanosensitive channel
MLIFVLVALCLMVNSGRGASKDQPFSSPGLTLKGTGESPQKTPSSPTGPGQNADARINEMVAGLSDDQVRSMLIQELKKSQALVVENDLPPGASGPAVFIDHVEDNLALFRERLQKVHEGAKALPRLIPQWYGDLQGSEGHKDVSAIVAAMLGLLLAGTGCEWLFRRYVPQGGVPVDSTENASGAGRMRIRGRLLTIDLSALGIFFLASLIVYSALLDHSETNRWLFLTYLAVMLIVRGISILSRLVLSPGDPCLRMVHWSDSAAAALQKWIMRITVVAVSGLFLGEFLELQGVSEELDLIVQGLTGVIVCSMLGYLVMAHRSAIGDIRVREPSGSPTETEQIPSSSSLLWKVPAVLYLILVWLLWMFYLLVGQTNVVVPLLVTISSIPLYKLLNHLAQKALLSMAELFQKTEQSVPAQEVEVNAATPAPGEPSGCVCPQPVKQDRVMPFMRHALSASIGIVISCWLIQLWGVSPHIGVTVMAAAGKILLALSLAFLIWHFIERAIEKRVKDVRVTTDDDEEIVDQEGGSTRLLTILQILRNFILIILLTIVSLIILSAVGIDIKPLLAGAGVIGLALGLGTQSLIKDIVSGMFFLVDDAFRIGDYVETGKIKGTVEAISIRSLKLRHPRGMVHTIPFSQLGSVTNFSRDYLISKLAFRVPYGTDIGKIKKIVKKINEKVKNDEDLGPYLLGPIKSIGVTGFDDSGLMMAVKFKSKPARQSELQRNVLKRLQESFQKSGLEFAHRHVVVRLPEEASSEKLAGLESETNQSSVSKSKGVLTAGAAAAVAMALAEEEAQQK